MEPMRQWAHAFENRLGVKRAFERRRNGLAINRLSAGEQIRIAPRRCLLLAHELPIQSRCAISNLRGLSMPTTNDKTNTLLLIENNAPDAKLILDALDDPSSRLFDVEWVGQLSEGLRLVGRGEIGLVVLDLNLPDSEGLDTFDKLFAAAPDIPVVIYAELSETAIASEAVRRGAYDYLLKDHLDRYTLTRALRHMISHKKAEEALLSENQLAHITLNAIGDAVLSTDVGGTITFLNPVAENMTGWSSPEALGRPIGEVLRIVDGTTRQPARNPLELAVQQNAAVGMDANSVLIRRDGTEFQIEDSAAPIRNRQGRVTGAVIVFRDVSASRAASAKMAYLAQHDYLTGLPNRMLLADRIDQAIAFAKRNHEQAAVLFLDLDRLKSINDSIGHFAGDQLLQSVARRLVSCGRQSDTVSRQGGDEFVILLPRLSHAENAGSHAEKILAAIAAPHEIAGKDVYIQASIGISTYPNDGEDAETLLKNADRAMYSAKESGRNGYEFCRAELGARAAERRSLESQLRGAVERREFVLHYQPKIDLQTGEIIGVEALVRWLRSGRELVAPAQFLPLAEECGLIVAIGQWVLREACEQLAAWRRQGLPQISLSVNLSTAEFRAKRPADAVGAALKESGLEPHLLELDLTENLLMNHGDVTMQTLQEFRKLGVQLALDDFGTGFSSLSKLKTLPISALKIDRSFVREINSGTSYAAMTTALIDLAKSMKMRVLAEGVETRDQCNFLRVQGCSEGQGYYFSRPLPAAQCAELLRAGIAATAAN